MTHSSIVILLFACFAILTLHLQTLNPYGIFSRFKRPFRTVDTGGEIELVQRLQPAVRTFLLWKLLAYYKCAWHIISNVRGGARAKGKTLDTVIRDIHKVRFDPHKPYLISGDHFNVLYPRNLGIFYHATLDPHTALDEIDWNHRQRIYLQTVAFILDVFGRLGDCTTTIVPVGPRAVSCINIYRYPSDSLYGLLWGLSALRGASGPYAHYFPHEGSFRLRTRAAAEKLLQEHKESIARLFEKYVAHVYDPDAGLIKRDVAISSAKDSVLRQSSFYDNVIFWKTCRLAQELGASLPGAIDCDALKQRILDNFWSEEHGHFLDDLSEESKKEGHYSSDWLVAVFTGFLDAENLAERRYMRSVVEYTMRCGLDMPFPLRYQETDQSHREVFLVRAVVPAYGGSAIWSFWGCEFIKLLIVLSRFDGCEEYRTRAEGHIQTYEKLMVKYRGYPEVYDTRGKLLRTPLYRSVRQTGWVVGFEQAQKLLRAAEF